jgi:hypothetical protein
MMPSPTCLTPPPHEREAARAGSALLRCTNSRGRNDKLTFRSGSSLGLPICGLHGRDSCVVSAAGSY